MSIKEQVKEDLNDIELNMIRNKIENMTKINQIEVLRILQQCNNITLNENNYGVHVNLTDVSPNIIQQIKTYIQYVETQENDLQYIELQKNNMKTLFKEKQVKEYI